MGKIQILHSVEWERVAAEVVGLILFKFSPICPVSRGVERDFDAWYAQLSVSRPRVLCVKINVYWEEASLW